METITLKPAARDDMHTIWQMQIEAFAALLEKYQDVDMSPAAEQIHGSSHWCLDTILQEPGNLHLYEKMGYHQTGRVEQFNDRMDIVYYEKD